MGKKLKKEKLKTFEARIKYPAYFSKKDFFGSWHTVKATSVEAAKKKIGKGTTLSSRRIQVRRKK